MTNFNSNMKRVGTGHIRNCTTDSSSVGKTTTAIAVIEGVTGSIPVYPIIKNKEMSLWQRELRHEMPNYFKKH